MLAREKGMTLIELMVTITVLAILLAFGLPSFQSWNGNLEIRNVAQSIQDGLRQAQLEASKRNIQVDFVMTADDLISTPNNASPTPSNTGTSWVIREVGSSANTFIQGKSRKDGSTSTSITVITPSPSSSFSGVISFDGLGRTTLASPVVLQVSSTKGDRPLRIQISVGGKVRMCNPNFAAGDPQACS